MLQKKKWIAVALAGYLSATTTLNAQIIQNDTFFYRDFLDLGQNKGAFSAGGKCRYPLKQEARRFYGL